MADPTPTTGLAAVNARVGNASFALGMAEKIAEGRYSDAAVQGGMRIAFTPQVYEAAATLTQAVKPVATAMKFVGANLPGLGAIVVGVYGAIDVVEHLKKGDVKGAMASGVAGVAETAGTFFLGGVGGAVAREAVVAGFAVAGGPKVNHSALVTVGVEAVKLGAKGVEKGSKFVQGLGAEQHPQHVVAAAPKEDKPTTPKKRPQPAMSMS